MSCNRSSSVMFPFSNSAVKLSISLPPPDPANFLSSRSLSDRELFCRQRVWTCGRACVIYACISHLSSLSIPTTIDSNTPSPSSPAPRSSLHTVAPSCLMMSRFAPQPRTSAGGSAAPLAPIRLPPALSELTADLPHPAGYFTRWRS